MAAKLRATVISADTSLFKAITSNLVRKKLQETIQLVHFDPPSLENSDTKNTMKESIAQALGSSDVIIADHFDASHINEELHYYFCSNSCVLKFLQSTYAGCDKFTDAIINDKLTPPPYPVCRFGGYMGQHMAEFVIGHIIARERNMALMFQQQKEHKWERNLLTKYRTLNNLSIGIIGVGDIGKQVARMCKCFGMTVWGITRSRVTKETASPYVDYYRQFSGLSELMESCDYVCSILPSTPETKGLLTEEHFKLCSKKKSVFINVGRGDLTTEATIVTAIKNDWLGGAILDVTEKEPLPRESPLWDLPGITIIPHVAACSHDNENADMFTDQLVRLMNGQPLLYTVDFKRGY